MGDPSAAAFAASVVRAPIDAGRAWNFSRMFKAVGDPVRLRLLSMIGSARRERCALTSDRRVRTQRPDHLAPPQSAPGSGPVDSDRRGTSVYYRLIPAALAVMGAVLDVRSVISNVTGG